MTKLFPPKAQGPALSKARRDDRLAAALRANIKRRKDRGHPDAQTTDDDAVPSIYVSEKKVSGDEPD